ncbi:MAG: hypothetical protein ACD_65C00014G0001 [uncultured bacterium]|nr:MAG: hypothetical protein ACD_65C00014G0001 [uncultured bacterium]KKT02451.1 MAG: hypothetical protein UV80_C0003G0037 [Candidatus Peregrinibacteria bacterium GW2011_GWF2_43_17]KKT19318.1 MAG: hypothetical protein UW03_C0020G0023 [Candidatus Peregrinibacteria bacterium GW2011_GWA2_43_8]HAU40173.1 hypothetical protein [Candidatus Peregrinibacteria bacterium]
MKKIVVTLSIITLLASGCGELSTLKYNDAVVEKINSASDALNKTISSYDGNIPDLVTEETEIDTTEMKTAWEDAKTAVENCKALTTLVGKDQLQQAEVNAELENYLSITEEYLSSYEKMLTYYENDEYKDTPEKVSEYDAEIYEKSSLIFDSNNTLEDILEKYVK